MTTKIENLTHRKVLVRLSSGETLHLGPRITSPDLSDVEIRNDKVKKLEQRHIIALHHSQGAQSSGTRSRNRGSRGSGSGTGSEE